MRRFSGGGISVAVTGSSEQSEQSRKHAPSQGFRSVKTCHAEDSVCGPGEQAVAASCIPLSWAFMGSFVGFCIELSGRQRPMTLVLCQAFRKIMLPCRLRRYNYKAKGSSCQIRRASTNTARSTRDLLIECTGHKTHST